MRILLIISIACALGIVAAFLLLPDKSDKPEQPTVQPLGEGTLARVEGFSYKRTLDGKSEWELEAKSAVYSDDRQIARFDEVEATFWGKDGNTVSMKGSQGQFHVESQDIEISGGVVLSSSMGYTMTTDSLDYSSATRMIETESPVVIRGDSLVLSCKGLSLNIAEENISLEGGVKGAIWDAEQTIQGRGR